VLKRVTRSNAKFHSFHDSHWGRLQLRSPSVVAAEGFEAGVLAGCGFDRSAFEVSSFFREPVEVSRWDDGESMFLGRENTVGTPELLVLLSHLHFTSEHLRD
jgi:hypothetical protein